MQTHDPYMGISINMGTRSNCVMSNHEIGLSGYMKIHFQIIMIINKL